MPKLRLALAQTNPVVGDIRANSEAAFEAIEIAAKNGANLVLFGEMAITGYPIEDMAALKSFITDATEAVSALASRLDQAGHGEIAVVIGHPDLAANRDSHNWALAQNCASVLIGGKVTGRYAKHHLPNYSVFDEYRNFVPGRDLLTFDFNGLKFSTLICEDIWENGGPVAQLAGSNTDIVLVLNGSPFEIDKGNLRQDLVRKLATENNAAVAYVNLVGGQDDLVFDGDSLLVDSSGKLIGRAKQFESDLVFFDIESKTNIKAVGDSHSIASDSIASNSANKTESEQLQEIWNALVLGLKDYVNKNRFKSVLLGLSGGIDSAVCAAIAADAIGAKQVHGVSMPSRYSSDHSRSDAADLAERIGLHFRTEPIEPMVEKFESQLGLVGLAAENLQARVRAVILMGLSNADGHLVLTTGNKTELAVGYSTIYGDSVGGFAPLKDVQKTLVWKLASWRNQFALENNQIPPIPENSINKPPSAELHPGQTDQDDLPDYKVLDKLLDAYVVKRLGRDQIIALGFEPTLVDRIIALVDKAEWKRRQSAIGPKITGLAFGRDRRLPITNRSN